MKERSKKGKAEQVGGKIRGWSFPPEGEKPV